MNDLRAHSRRLAWGMRLDRLPPLTWLALTAAASWPAWWWLAARGAAAAALLAAGFTLLAGAAWHGRRHWRASPRLAWFAVALFAVLAATASVTQPATDAWLALLALAAAFAAAWPLDTSMAAQSSPWRRLGGRLHRWLAHAPFENTLAGRVGWKLTGALLLPLCLAWGSWRMVAG
jgi:hypothetical protein